MKLKKKKTKQGQCCAMRCKEVAGVTGFCDRHLTEHEYEQTGEAAPPRSKDPVEAAGMRAGLAYVQAEIDRDAIAVEVKAEVEQHTGSIQELVTDLPLFQIQNDSDMSFANELLGEIKDKIKGLEERRKTVSKPLNDALRTYNGWFKKPLDALKTAEQTLKAKISDALITARKAQDVALAAIEASGGEAATEVLAVAHGQQLVKQPDNISIREVWAVEILDSNAVPRAFCDPNLDRLKAYAQATNGAEPVAGVRFFKEQIVGQRASGNK